MRASGQYIYKYHEQGPEGVVEKDNRGSQQHGDAHEFVELRDRVVVSQACLDRHPNMHMALEGGGGARTIVENPYG